LNFIKNYLEKNSGSLWLVLAQLIKVAFNGAAFFMVARQLGPADFGGFIALSAIFGIVAPIADFGLYHVNIQKHAQGDAIGGLIGASLITVIVGFLVLIIPATLFSVYYLKAELYTVLFVGLTLLFAEKAFAITNSILVCTGNFKIFSRVEVAQGFFRLCGCFILVYLDGRLWHWALINLIQTLCIALILIYLVLRVYRVKLPSLYQLKDRFASGKSYVISTLLDVGVQEADRLILAKIAGNSIVGQYGAVMRINNFATIPLNAILLTSYKGFFTSGAGGLKSSFSYAITVIKKTLPVSFVIAVCIILFSPLIIYLLGDQFSGIKSVLMLSAFIPVVLSITQPLLDALTGAGMQRLRIKIQLLSLILNVVLLYLITPLFGIFGAVASIIVSRLIIVPFVVLMRK
jgi:O-antigen/teichoic acid export membrane protein